MAYNWYDPYDPEPDDTWTGTPEEAMYMAYNPDNHRAFGTFRDAVEAQQRAELAAVTRSSDLAEPISDEQWLALSPAELERWAATGKLS